MLCGGSYSYENNYSALRGHADRSLSTLARAAQPALTIYNQNFAVVRDSVPLDLKQGVNDVRFTETTAHLEPDSVILRDPRQNEPANPRTELSERSGLAGIVAFAI